jgi:hypothetical protein
MDKKSMIYPSKAMNLRKFAGYSKKGGNTPKI